jgi:hypothetical protein
MSENLDLVRSIYAAIESGDYSSAAWAAPEIEYVIADGPAPGSWTGLSAMAAAWREVLSAFEGFHQEVENYRELDGGVVLVLTINNGRGKTSVRQGMEVVRTRPEQVIDLGERIAIRLAFLTRGQASGAITSQTVGIIAHMTPRGRVPRLEWYWTWEETLEALNDHSGTLRAAGTEE